jgi:lipopolysaccharide transport protein LptA
MRALLLGIISVLVCTTLVAQDKPKKSTKPAKTAPAAKEDAAEKKSGPIDLAHPTEAVTTEIYADEAFFDSPNNVGKFTGHVKVNDPRFAMQSDKLTAYISKENKGLEKAVADSHVAVVRDRPDPNGGPPQRTLGLSDNAIYTTVDGIVQLTGNPRVQQGVNMHIATSPDTVMILNQEGQLTTRGPSRTEIRQEPSPSPSASASPGASPSPGASASPSPSESPKP